MTWSWDQQDSGLDDNWPTVQLTSFKCALTWDVRTPEGRKSGLKCQRIHWQEGIAAGVPKQHGRVTRGLCHATKKKKFITLGTEEDMVHQSFLLSYAASYPCTINLSHQECTNLISFHLSVLFHCTCTPGTVQNKCVSSAHMM